MTTPLTKEFLEKIIALGAKIPKGPWGTPRNAFELFHRDFPDWGEVYANLRGNDGEVYSGCVILKANQNLISEEAKKEARVSGERNPGLAGDISEYVAQLPPEVTTAMAQEILYLRAELATARKHLGE